MRYELAGIIRDSQTWSSGDVVSLSGDVQIAEGVVLEVGAGATLDLNGYSILNFGTLQLSGNETSFATLTGGTYSTDSTQGVLNSDFGRLEQLYVNSFFSNGALVLDNSLILNSTIEALSANVVKNSIFSQSEFDLGIESATVYKSTFLETTIEVLAWNTFFGGRAEFNEVNFVSEDQAIYLSPFFSGSDVMHHIEIIESYINAEDPDSKIYDADDDLRIRLDILDKSFSSTPITTTEAGFQVGTYLISLSELGIAENSVNPDTSDLITDLYTTSVIIDSGVLAGYAVLLEDLTEKIVRTGDEITSHTISYLGVEYDYDQIDRLIMTVTRDDEFTAEYQQEIADFAPQYADISFDEAVTLIGVNNISSVMLQVAGADGSYVG